MKKRYNLPILPPEFICDSSLTLSNCIIRANVGDKWSRLVSSKFINCFYKDEATKHKFVISTYDHWCTTRNIMQNQQIDLLKNMYKPCKIDIIKSVKYLLHNGSYVLGQCNSSYVGNSLDRDLSLFNYALTGYDDVSHEFLISGVNEKDEYISTRINYLDFVSALFDTPKSNISFALWKYTKVDDINLDIANIIFELDDYLNSVNRRMQYVEDKIYGINSIQKMAQHIVDCAESDSLINAMCLNKLKVHKEYMEKRILHLAQSNIIDPQWILFAKEVNEKIKSAFENYQLFNRNHKSSLIDIMLTCICDSINIEKNYLRSVLNELKTCEINQNV